MFPVKNRFLLHYPAVIFSFMIMELLFSSLLHGYECRTSVSGEVVRDIINYSDEEPSLLARGRFSENIDDTFIFNYSVLRDINMERNKYTWNVGLMGLNDHLDFTAGHYNLRFGSGLIMGRKKFITADPFTRSLAVSGDEAIIPATGTNPSVAFFGTAAKLYSSGDEFSAGFIPFISSQKRYITADELSQGYACSSLPTLSERTSGSSKYSESANIVNYGGMIWFSCIDYLTIQGYGFSTELRDSEMKNLKWEYDEEMGTGISRYNAGGIFIEYGDEVVSFFIEPAFSSREYGRAVTGRAVMWGCGVKSREIIFTMRGKNCDPEFRGEYSSGDRNPENVFEIKAGILPLKYLEFGASAYSEKNLNPSYESGPAGGTMREEIYSGIKPSRWIKLDFNAARARSYSDDLSSEKYKLSSSLLLSMPWNIFFRIKSDIQEEGSSTAYVSACELKYLFFDYFTLSAGYTDIRVGRDTGIYAAIIPAAEAEMCTSLYTESARGGALKLRYRRESLSFHARGSLVETCGERELTAESSLGFVF